MIRSKLFEYIHVRKIYNKLLKKFFNINKKYKDAIEKKSQLIDKVTLHRFTTEIDDLLSDILEFYCFARTYDILVNKLNNKIIIYCGLSHIDKIYKILMTNLNYKLKFKKGVINMSDITIMNNENLCIDIMNF